jgi:hypothetical protein
MFVDAEPVDRPVGGPVDDGRHLRGHDLVAEPELVHQLAGAGAVELLG